MDPDHRVIKGDHCIWKGGWGYKQQYGMYVLTKLQLWTLLKRSVFFTTRQLKALIGKRRGVFLIPPGHVKNELLSRVSAIAWQPEQV